MKFKYSIWSESIHQIMLKAIKLCMKEGE